MLIGEEATDPVLRLLHNLASYLIHQLSPMRLPDFLEFLLLIGIEQRCNLSVQAEFFKRTGWAFLVNLLTRRSQDESESSYFNFAYSALACFRMGTSGSASFHNAKKS